MDNDKLGYEIYYVSCANTKLSIKFLASGWYFFIYKCVDNSKNIEDLCPINEEGHKQIAELIGMPWEYYKRCLEEEPHPVVLLTNVNYWLRDLNVLRLIHSIHVQRDQSGFQINLKEKT